MPSGRPLLSAPTSAEWPATFSDPRAVFDRGVGGPHAVGPAIARRSCRAAFCRVAFRRDSSRRCCSTCSGWLAAQRSGSNDSRSVSPAHSSQHHVPKIRPRLQAMTLGSRQDREQHRRTRARLGTPQERPVSPCRWPGVARSAPRHCCRSSTDRRSRTAATPPTGSGRRSPPSPSPTWARAAPPTRPASSRSDRGSAPTPAGAALDAAAGVSSRARSSTS